MKYCRFHLNGDVRYGLVESVAGRDEITRLLVTPPEEVGGDMEDLRTKQMARIPLSEAELSVPVRPSKIVCVGRNYREHANELGNEVPTEPLLFFKPTTSLIESGGTIRRPRLSERTDYEGEVGVVISKPCYKLSDSDDVRPYILGYTGLNDFTARDLQKKDGQWARAKGFDTFCQDGNTRDFIFPLDLVIRYIAQVMTLLPGDLIATGTPKGVGPVVAGDVIEVWVEGVGTLRNPVTDE
jgi:2-keto-4-pentenoate hydratase/2-oxohepta-3-ene-1,7-dioic acid hydratase in catechol pathway